MSPITITDQDWQPALGQVGDVVTGVDDIGQCIRIILTTPKGADPLRPEFGSNIWRYIDQPIDHVRPHLVREAWVAIETWEPRARLVRISPRAGDQPSQLVLRIVWAGAGRGEHLTEVSV